MLTKRIIPCLDIRNGRVVKGIGFKGLIDAGDPVALALDYCANGADELVFLDISATQEKRSTMLKWVNEVAAAINIPFTVGGGIQTAADVDLLLKNGADKVSVNTSAVKNPGLITELASLYGSQCVVVAIDARLEGGIWQVYLAGGSIPAETDLFTWAAEAERRGAGEILFTSIDNDGAKSGFANEAIARLSGSLNIPIIASGGAGTMEHFTEVFTRGKADAALAASVFHFKEIEIPELKSLLKKNQVSVRL